MMGLMIWFLNKLFSYNTVVVDFKNAIIEEKESPIILKYKKELVEELDLLIKGQEECLTEDASSDSERLFITFYKLEIERMKYLLKSYLRTRLFKLEKFVYSIIREEIDSEWLSEAETEYILKFFVHK